MADLDDFLGGESLGALQRDAEGLSAAFAAELGAVREEMKRTSAEADRLSGSITGSLRRALDGLIFGGKRASDTMRQLGRDLTGKVLNAALAPVQNAVTGGITSLVSGGVGSLLGGLGLFANGSAFSAGRVRAFAGGGVVEGPTLFPMRGGTGLMGEAGPEAILPLQRGPDGRLGVAMSGRGGGGNVTVNIHTRDAESFRRSRGQVAAAIGRAVNAGARNQ